MTKFEEEVKRPKKAYIDPFSKRDVDFTGLAKKFTEGAQTLKEWKEYAFLLEDKLKLQQQALPVVSEGVVDWVDNSREYYYEFEEWFDSNNQSDVIYQWLNCENKRHAELNALALATLIVNGRDAVAVEKPQLFYLKHIDMSKLDETHDWFILHHGSLGHSPFCKGELPYYCNNAKFTQQEIDSMQTGSYEQIEVEK